MEQLLRTLKEKSRKCSEHLEIELNGLRANRAHPSLVEEVKVDAYDGKLPLKQLASITAPEANLILVQVWDKSIVPNVEKAINNSGQGLSGSVEGDFLRIVLPPLSQDRRSELIKLAHRKGEEAQVSLRNVRHEVIEEMRQLKLSEDEEERFKKSVDEHVSEMSARMRELIDAKEQDIGTV